MAQYRASQGEIARIRALVQTMSRDSLIYKMLKEELMILGYWRNRPRGNPKKGFERKSSKLT